MLKRIPKLIAGVLLICNIAGVVSAEKELMYDPEKGIIFVEKGTAAPSGKPAETSRSQKLQPENRSQQRTKTASRRSHSRSDLHIGRKKDPPELYFRSGLEYYKNGDFTNALKNFTFADSVHHRPEYRLWIGKTLRSLGRIDEMLKTMFTIIKNEPDCDVADDALFELGLHYKNVDDYDKATQLYSQLIEQYPFAMAYPTGEELREIAREQRRLMRAEMINILTILGYIDEDLPSSYRNFQEKNGLPVTGTGDRQTILAIKKQHREYLEQEERKVQKKQRFERYSVWLYGAIGIGTINILLLLLLLSKVKAHKRHITEMHKIISDLNVQKL
ncbi:MAG: tetratricopeptide repeat protein [Chitinispirillaceae bacterium]|nr:tetratricopeptide repeat protein [Chitinispirillaceae bacterium]